MTSPHGPFDCAIRPPLAFSLSVNLIRIELVYGQNGIVALARTGTTPKRCIDSSVGDDLVVLTFTGAGESKGARVDETVSLVVSTRQVALNHLTHLNGAVRNSPNQLVSSTSCRRGRVFGEELLCCCRLSESRYRNWIPHAE